MDTVATINVGGKLFSARLETLVRSPFFRNIFAGDFKRRSPEDLPLLFVDRCPKLFVHVLRRMRDFRYNFPTKHLNELDFYGLGGEGAPDRGSTPAQEFGTPEYPIRAGKTFLQVGARLVRKKDFVAFRVCSEPPVPNKIFLEKFSIPLWSDLLTIQGIKHKENMRLDHRMGYDDLILAFRNVAATLGVETRETSVRKGNNTHWYLYVPTRLCVSEFDREYGTMQVADSFYLPDLTWYADWCLKQ